jgi:hypothetical protein
MATNINGMLNTANRYSYLFNNSATQRQNSIASLWNNYGNFQNNAASNLGALNEIRQNAAAVVDSYNEAKDTFYTEFDSNMSALKKSASDVKNLKIDVGENPITKTEVTGEDGKTETKITYSKGMQSALDSIKSLVDNYNDSLSFLKNNSAVSDRVGRLAANFGDTTYRSSLYEQVGISVGNDGTLSINEDRLANSIAENPNKVSRILGKDGLAGKAEQHVDTANGQRNNLFPSAKSMLGKQLDQAEIYTGKSMINMTNISNVGNLVNMMF